MKMFSFKKNQRLTTNAQFKHVLSHKCCIHNDLFRLYARSNDLGYPRLGLSIGKKCGNAVKRNRLKRLAREAFRTSMHDIPAKYDYLLIYTPIVSKKPSVPQTIGFDEIKRLFVDSAERAVKKSQIRATNDTEKASGE